MIEMSRDFNVILVTHSDSGQYFLELLHYQLFYVQQYLNILNSTATGNQANIYDKIYTSIIFYLDSNGKKSSYNFTASHVS